MFFFQLVTVVLKIVIKVSEPFHFSRLNQCINYFEIFDVSFYSSFYLKMDFLGVKVLYKFEDFLSL